LTLNKSSAMNDLNWNEIIDWDWTQWIWYDIEPYSNSIYNINNNEILASEALNININWDQNIHIYNLKIWSMIDYEQISWIYQSNIDFGINLTY
jgi:hypothetical protein